MFRYSFPQFLRSRVLFFCGIAVCVFIALNFAKVFTKSYSTRQDIKKLKSEIGKLEKNQQRLQEFYTLLSSDFFAEKEARLKFGLQKQGERAIVIQKNETSGERNELSQHSKNNAVSSNLSSVQNSNGAQNSSLKQDNPRLWWDYFFGMLE